jgi:hypothetical protein
MRFSKGSKRQLTTQLLKALWGVTKDISPAQIQNIQFDIAITVVEKEGDAIEAGIKVLGVKLGGNTSGSTESTHVSRIQFSIPVIPPVTTVSN